MLLTNVRTARQKAGQRVLRRAAFTLLEVLIVVAILVILASAASFSLFRYLEDAKVGKAKSEMQTIVSAINKYYSENGSWPPPGSLAQTIGPMIDGNPSLMSPWNQPYDFQIDTTTKPDGTPNERPIVFCNTPHKGMIRMPPQ
jgi:general secretion pathway protein G